MGRRLSVEERAALDRESLDRARGGVSVMNEAAAVRAFMERGIPEGEIIPRVNVLTFNAWRALGRFVRKGEHGVKLTVWVPVKGPAEDGEEEATGKRAVTAVVFHVSQTEARS
jgi:hypothetical protein